MSGFLAQISGGPKMQEEHPSSSASGHINGETAAGNDESFTDLITGILGSKPKLEPQDKKTDQAEKELSKIINEEISTEQEDDIKFALYPQMLLGAAKTNIASAPEKNAAENSKTEIEGETQISNQRLKNVLSIKAAENILTPEKIKNILKEAGTAVNILGENVQEFSSISSEGLTAGSEGEKQAKMVENLLKNIQNDSEAPFEISKENPEKQPGRLQPTSSAKTDSALQKMVEKYAKNEGPLQFNFIKETEGKSPSSSLNTIKEELLDKELTNAANQKEANSENSNQLKKGLIKKAIQTSAGKEKLQSAAHFLEDKAAGTEDKTKKNRKNQSQGRSTAKEKPQSVLTKNRTVKPAQSSSLKADSNTSHTAGKSDSDPSFISIDADIKEGNLEDSDKNFEQIKSNNLKTANLSDSSGRKTFSKQLARSISRQQTAHQSQNARHAGEWKHHRFVLKDGNTINITSRTSNGALQLQLNAGPGELGKIIQQHLHDIQQHVQQQLGIEIDLQLQNFGKQQEKEHHSSAFSNKSAANADAGNNILSGTSTKQAEIHSVRYFGFNNNEWIA